MKIYSLFGGAGYYHDATELAQETLAILEARLGTLADQYLKTCTRYRSEVLLELLLMGVLWLQRREQVRPLHKPVRRFFRALRHLSPQPTFLRQAAKQLQGLSAGTFLVPNSPNRSQSTLTVEDLKALIRWMEASAEYKFEARRLRGWLNFLAVYPDPPFGDIEQTAGEFLMRGMDLLGRYTTGVDPFLGARAPRRFREDVILCSKGQGEYHLNMAGAEILNMAYRDEFLATSQRLVFLPACMCLKGSACPATPKSMGRECKACSPQCQVGEIASLGQRYGFDLAIMPHGSSFTQVGLAELAQRDVGVIGVACVTTLINGGWLLREFGIPAQCVLLESSGCRQHWDPVGQVTSINIPRLLDRLGVPV